MSCRSSRGNCYCTGRFRKQCACKRKQSAKRRLGRNVRVISLRQLRLFSLLACQGIRHLLSSHSLPLFFFSVITAVYSVYLLTP